MPRIFLEQLSFYPYSTALTVRVTDLNYGNHLSNDKLLAYAHESRVRFLASIGLAELDFAGVGLIMADAAVVFKQQAGLGDELVIEVGVGEINHASFDLHYRVLREDSESVVALLKTCMVCFDYVNSKVISIPETAQKALVEKSVSITSRKPD